MIVVRVRKTIPLGRGMKILFLVVSAFILVSNLLLIRIDIEKNVDPKSHIPSSSRSDIMFLPLSYPKVVSKNVVQRRMENVKPMKVILYSYLRKDQSGWVIMDMLKAHSWAYERNITYGGACGESRHKKDIQNVLTLSGFDKILPLKCPPTTKIHEDNNNNNNNNNNTKTFAAMVHDDGTRHVLYHASIYEKDYKQRLESLDWKYHVQQQLNYNNNDDEYNNSSSSNNNNNNNDQLRPNQTQTKTIRLVVHIRRRDVTPCCYPEWYLPNAYFVAMIDKYVQLARQEEEEEEYPSRSAANIQVDIFSQADSFESWTPFLEGYNNLNMHLHLDGEVGMVWKAILNADYFIGSKSEFSHVPAMFSRGKVINEYYDWPLLENEFHRVFAQCTDTMIFSCRHKWWQKNNHHHHHHHSPKIRTTDYRHEK
jgi:hypothetical protein